MTRFHNKNVVLRSIYIAYPKDLAWTGDRLPVVRHHQHVVIDVLVRHVPRAEVNHAGKEAGADALPLTDGVEPEAPVFADASPGLVDDRAWRRAQVV